METLSGRQVHCFVAPESMHLGELSGTPGELIVDLHDIELVVPGVQFVDSG